MTKITYAIPNKQGSIYWAEAEEFTELYNQTFHLNKMDAKDIVTLTEYTEMAKILLSAVAGATIQHLLDEGEKFEDIFQNGTFVIEAE